MEIKKKERIRGECRHGVIAGLGGSQKGKVGARRTEQAGGGGKLELEGTLPEGGFQEGKMREKKGGLMKCLVITHTRRDKQKKGGVKDYPKKI